MDSPRAVNPSRQRRTQRKASDGLWPLQHFARRHPGPPADGLDCSPEALFRHYHRDLTISLVDQQQLPLALSGKGLRVDGVGLRKRAIAFYFGDGEFVPGPNCS